jgi:hypothetical protein
MWSAEIAFSDDPDLRELHEIARKIGLKPEWFQTDNPRFPHYDLTASKRRLALLNGAHYIPLRSWIIERRELESVFKT